MSYVNKSQLHYGHMSKSASLKTKLIDLIVQGMKSEAIEDKVSEVYAIGEGCRTAGVSKA